MYRRATINGSDAPRVKLVRNRGYMHPMQLHTISMYNSPLCMAPIAFSIPPQGPQYYLTPYPVTKWVYEKVYTHKYQIDKNLDYLCRGEGPPCRTPELSPIWLLTISYGNSCTNGAMDAVSDIHRQLKGKAWIKTL